jgi:hypothetical protein
MMIPGFIKVRLFAKSAANSALGILVEVFLTALFIITGFFVSFAWWEILGR